MKPLLAIAVLVLAAWASLAVHPGPERGSGAAAPPGGVSPQAAHGRMPPAVATDPRLRMTAAFTPGKLAPFIAALPEPEMTFLLTGHTAGWITPCGCKGNSGGGLARRAGYRDALRAAYPGRPVHFLDTGGFASFGGEVERIMTDAVLSGMKTIGYTLAAVGRSDLGQTLAQFESLGARLPVPRVSANLVFHDNGKPAFEPYRIIETAAARDGKAPLRVAVFGLNNDRASMFAFGPSGRSIRTDVMEEAIARWLPEARRKADFVLLIGEFRPDQAFRVVTKSPGMIDLIVAGEGADLSVEPFNVLGVPVHALGNQGKYLGEIRFHREKGKVRASTRVFLLDDRFPSDLAIATNSERVLDQANEVSRREVLATHRQEKAQIWPFVGASECASCHQESFAIWKASGHANAFAALQRTNRDYSASCTACHVTGQGGDLDLGGGFVNPVATPQLLGVQCEACHGAGAEHAEKGTPEYGTGAAAVCVACHSPEQDPDFDFDTYWPKIAHR